MLGTVEIPRKRWTRGEAHALVELGFPRAQHLELVEGELISRTGKKRPQVIWHNLIHEWLVGIFGFDRVESEAPMDVAAADNEHSEQEPDLKVLRKSSRDYANNPRPEDVVLAVEIADSTLQFDLNVKANLYGRAGIEDYWVVNLPARVLIVHRSPANGRYTSVIAYAASEAVDPLAAPGSPFSLDLLKA